LISALARIVKSSDGERLMEWLASVDNWVMEQLASAEEPRDVYRLQGERIALQRLRQFLKAAPGLEILQYRDSPNTFNGSESSQKPGEYPYADSPETQGDL
jgi:hypothetical protein